MSFPPPARRRRLRLPRRVFSRVLLMRPAIAEGVAVLATGLFLAPLGRQLDEQAMRRALAIAATTAENRQLALDPQHTAPSADGPVQLEAERIRKVAGAEYIVMEIDTGTLGRSAHGKVPLYGDSHRIVGAVFVGIAYNSVRAKLIGAIPGLHAYAGGVRAAVAVAARTGLSRSTAQRCPRRLEQAGRLRLSLKHGDTGRPEHRYAWGAP